MNKNFKEKFPFLFASNKILRQANRPRGRPNGSPNIRPNGSPNIRPSGRPRELPYIHLKGSWDWVTSMDLSKALLDVSSKV